MGLTATTEWPFSDGHNAFWRSHHISASYKVAGWNCAEKKHHKQCTSERWLRVMVQTGASPSAPATKKFGNNLIYWESLWISIIHLRLHNFMVARCTQLWIYVDCTRLYFYPTKNVGINLHSTGASLAATAFVSTGDLRNS